MAPATAAMSTAMPAFVAMALLGVSSKTAEVVVVTVAHVAHVGATAVTVSTVYPDNPALVNAAAEFVLTAAAKVDVSDTFVNTASASAVGTTIV